MKTTVEDIHAYMLIPLQGVGTGEQEEQTEEVPLQLKIRVAGEIDAQPFSSKASERIEGPDGDHRENKPTALPANPGIELVDGRCQLLEKLH